MRLLGLGKYLDKTSNKTDHNLNFERHVLLHKYFLLFIFHSKNLTLFHTEGKEHYHRLNFPELCHGTLSLELIKKCLERYLWQGREGCRLCRRCWELRGTPAKTGGRLREDGILGVEDCSREELNGMWLISPHHGLSFYVVCPIRRH